MTLNLGTKLGAYQIQSAIGAGGMGEVYRAVDMRLNRTVAIKVLPGHLSESPEAKERFDREARAISALNHARICTLYDVGHQDGVDFLIMEFLEGESLADRLRKGALPVKETLKIGIDVCEALEAAHRHGIVHRDLKPGNIMLTPGGAKLMDFGLAKPLGVAAASSRAGSAPSFTAVATALGSSPISPLTSAGTIVGTIQYMSPEQIEGKEADARSDIFALGSVLYEMAAGKRPFEGKSQISLASAILEKDPEPISTIKPMTPPAFDYTVNTCLQKNPDDRFQTAHDVKLQLQWIVTSSSSTGMKAMPATAPAKRVDVLPGSLRRRCGSGGHWACGIPADSPNSVDAGHAYHDQSAGEGGTESGGRLGWTSGAVARWEDAGIYRDQAVTARLRSGCVLWIRWRHNRCRAARMQYFPSGHRTAVHWDFLPTAS